MKARKLNIKTIPARDINRAYRFWRDTFDLPQDGAGTERHLLIDNQTIQFVVGEPIDHLEMLVRDHQNELVAHLLNHFVTIVQQPQPISTQKFTMIIQDSEGNHLVMEGNNDKNK